MMELNFPTSTYSGNIASITNHEHAVAFSAISMFDVYLHFPGRRAEYSQPSSVIAMRAKLSRTKASTATSLWKPQIHHLLCLSTSFAD